MGDMLRQLGYPLVLPAIVVCVWAHAWAVKQDARAGREIPADASTAVAVDEPSHVQVSGPVPAFPTHWRTMASTGDEGED